MAAAGGASGTNGAATPLQLALASVMVALSAALAPSSACAGTLASGAPDLDAAAAAVQAGLLGGPTTTLAMRLASWASAATVRSVGQRLAYGSVGQLVVTVNGVTYAVTLVDAGAVGASTLSGGAGEPAAQPNVVAAIVGGVIAALVAVAAIVAAVVILRRPRRQAAALARARAAAAAAPDGVDTAARIPVASLIGDKVRAKAPFLLAMASGLFGSRRSTTSADDDAEADKKAAALEPFNPSAPLQPDIVRPAKRLTLRDGEASSRAVDRMEPTKLGQFAAFSSMASNRNISSRALGSTPSSLHKGRSSRNKISAADKALDPKTRAAARAIFHGSDSESDNDDKRSDDGDGKKKKKKKKKRKSNAAVEADEAAQGVAAESLPGGADETAETVPAKAPKRKASSRIAATAAVAATSPDGDSPAAVDSALKKGKKSSRNVPAAEPPASGKSVRSITAAKEAVDDDNPDDATSSRKRSKSSRKIAASAGNDDDDKNAQEQQPPAPEKASRSSSRELPPNNNNNNKDDDDGVGGGGEAQPPKAKSLGDTPRSKSKRDDAAAPALPAGWVAKVSRKSGDTYYRHADGRTAWTLEEVQASQGSSSGGGDGGEDAPAPAPALARRKASTRERSDFEPAADDAVAPAPASRRKARA